MPSWLEDVTVAAVIGVIIAVGVALPQVKWLWIGIKNLSNFIRDWTGYPARNGKPAQPGVMETLTRLQEALDDVQHSVKPNGGSSPHDTLAKKIEATSQQQEKQSQQLSRMGATLTRLEYNIDDIQTRLTKTDGRIEWVTTKLDQLKQQHEG